MLEKIVGVIIEIVCVRMKVDTCSHTRKVLKWAELDDLNCTSDIAKTPLQFFPIHTKMIRWTSILPF